MSKEEQNFFFKRLYKSDTEYLKKKLYKGRKVGTKFANTKKYLYEMILESLSTFNDPENIRTKLNHAEILTNRELTMDADELLLDVINQSQKNQDLFTYFRAIKAHYLLQLKLYSLSYNAIQSASIETLIYQETNRFAFSEMFYWIQTKALIRHKQYIPVTNLAYNNKLASSESYILQILTNNANQGLKLCTEHQ